MMSKQDIFIGREKELRNKLRQKGHNLLEQGPWSKKVSRVCTILIEQEHGTLAGGADSRSTSYAVGW